jgi:hypothetical protein
LLGFYTLIDSSPTEERKCPSRATANAGETVLSSNSEKL